MMRLTYMFLIICLLLPTNLIGQVPQFNHLTINDGLSQSSINTMIQDSEGFIWMGTKNGLNRYDGNEFKKYWHIPGDTTTLNNGFITVIKEDDNGKIWIGSESGLNIYDRTVDYMQSVKMENGSHHFLNNVTINDIAFYGGHTWIATAHGMYKVTASQNPGIYDTELYQAREFISSILCVENNLLLGFRSGKIAEFDPSKGTILRSADPDCGAGQLHLGYFSNNTIAVSGGSGFNLISLKDFIIKKIPYLQNAQEMLKGIPVNSLLTDKLDRIWIATSNGVYVVDKKRNVTYRSSQNKNDLKSVSYNMISSMLQSSDGTIWLGTDGLGLNLWHTSFQKFETITRFPTDHKSFDLISIRCIKSQNDSIVWIGGYTGLVKFNEKNMSYDVVSNISADVYNLEWDKEDPEILWIATEGRGLYKFNVITQDFKLYNMESTNGTILSNYVSSILDNGDGSLWVGNGSGLLRFDKKKEEFVKQLSLLQDINGLKGVVIRYIFKDKAGRLWIGTKKGGLNLLDEENNRFKHYFHDNSDPKSIGNNFILSIFEDSYGDIWVGTISGLNKFVPEDETFIKFNTSNELIDDDIYGILEDDEKNLWLSCDKGLMVFSIDDNKLVNHFTVTDGLQGNEFNSIAYHKTRKGTMYFGGINGLNLFNPAKIKFNSYSPDILITGFKIFNEDIAVKQEVLGRVILQKPIELMEEIVIDYQHKVVTFEFSALSFMLSEKNHYTYIMEGFEDTWNYVKTNNSATYTNLPAGEYTLKIKASNQDGFWTDKTKELRIIVIPPWWDTYWFYISSISFVVLMTLWIVKKREQILVRQKLVLQIGIEERTAEINLQKNQMDNLNSELTLQNQRIKDSITYAYNIQRSILPSNKAIRDLFQDFFVLYKPRDIVSGDFFWCHMDYQYKYMCVADCTGHGVPGALMSILGAGLLDKIVKQEGISEPFKILNALSNEIRIKIAQHRESDVLDGMDLSIVRVNLNNDYLVFSGACSSGILLKKNKLIKLVGDELPIGFITKEPNYGQQEFKLSQGDQLYLYSDGFADQIGEKSKKKFYHKNFIDLLQEVSDKPLDLQELILAKKFDEWKGNRNQIDDVCIAGMKF